MTATPPYLGSHMSIAGGVELSPARAASVGCTAFQIFVKNNRSWQGPPITAAAARAFGENLLPTGIPVERVFAHATYLINLASAKEDVESKSIAAMADELERCDLLGIPGIVVHPGAALTQSRDEAIERVARNIRAVFEKCPQVRTRLLLETTVGNGTNLGGPFEDLRDILAAANLPDRLGICMDSCHVFCAGYELRTPEGYAATMEEFDRLVGIGNLRAIHLNDSKHILGSKKDRHEHIGEGELGLEPFRHLLNDPRLRHLPMALETDKGDDMEEDRRNLAVLRGLVR